MYIEHTLRHTHTNTFVTAYINFIHIRIPWCRRSTKRIRHIAVTSLYPEKWYVHITILQIYTQRKCYLALFLIHETTLTKTTMLSLLLRTINRRSRMDQNRNDCFTRILCVTMPYENQRSGDSKPGSPLSIFLAIKPTARELISRNFASTCNIPRMR